MRRSTGEHGRAVAPPRPPTGRRWFPPSGRPRRVSASGGPLHDRVPPDLVVSCAAIALAGTLVAASTSEVQETLQEQPAAEEKASTRSPAPGDGPDSGVSADDATEAAL